MRQDDELHEELRAGVIPRAASFAIAIRDSILASSWCSGWLA
jgi:hypothetical protein